MCIAYILIQRSSESLWIRRPRISHHFSRDDATSEPEVAAAQPHVGIRIEIRIAVNAGVPLRRGIGRSEMGRYCMKSMHSIYIPLSHELGSGRAGAQWAESL